MFLALGNENANRIWEENAKPEDKPNHEGDRPIREKWIKSKYLTKDFLVNSRRAYKDQEQTNKTLYRAAEKGDLKRVAEALAHGAEVDWKNPDDHGRTPLHACAMSARPEKGKWYAMESAELLIQNGARMDVLDLSDHSVLDCAVIHNSDREMVEYLAKKLE